MLELQISGPVVGGNDTVTQIPAGALVYLAWDHVLPPKTGLKAPGELQMQAGGAQETLQSTVLHMIMLTPNLYPG